MTDTNDERLRVAVRAHCFEEMVDRECTYPVCSLRCGKISEGHGRAIIAAPDAHDRAQGWGPEAREAMARDACNAWLNAPGSDWLLVVDAVLRHVRGPMPSGLTIGMSSAAIQAYREGPGDIVERMDRALTAALAAAPQPDQPMPPAPFSARPKNGSATMVEAAEQALTCLLGETPEVGTPDEARADTIEKLRAALNSTTPDLTPIARQLQARQVPQQEGEKSAGVASAAPAAMTPLAAELTKIAAACRPTDHGTMAEAFAAIHTVLSTLVAEREAQARRDERVREAARKLGSETYDVALSALAAALGEDGR